MKNYILPFLFILCTLSISCKKEAGFGGLSSIEGKVYAIDLTPNSQIIQDEGYTANIKVILSVDGSGHVLKEQKTDLNGSYKFKNLRKGNYTVWTFTQCDQCTNNDSTVIQTIEIKARKEALVLPDFKIEI